jgi:peroxiredoxin
MVSLFPLWEPAWMKLVPHRYSVSGLFPMNQISQRVIPFTPSWMRLILQLAGIYNLLWGLWVIFAPQWSFSACGFPEPANPLLWQCLGMVIGVYGVGYWLAAADPVRHWPIVLVGLLGKLFGPLGFLIYWLAGSLPLEAARTLVFNDLIWWVPFLLILWHAFLTSQKSLPDDHGLTVEEALEKTYSQVGSTLGELSAKQSVLLVFLRHLGCTFCREALSDLQKQRKSLEEQGVQIALVHMSDNDTAGKAFANYGLEDVPRFSDPEQRLYRSFDLGQGSFRQLLGPAVFWRGLVAALFQRHGWGPIQGNGLRMPGVFLLREGKILMSYRHGTAADRPDYAGLACSTSEITSTEMPS